MREIKSPSFAEFERTVVMDTTRTKLDRLDGQMKEAFEKFVNELVDEENARKKSRFFFFKRKLLDANELITKTYENKLDYWDSIRESTIFFQYTHLESQKDITKGRLEKIYNLAYMTKSNIVYLSSDDAYLLFGDME